MTPRRAAYFDHVRAVNAGRKAYYDHKKVCETRIYHDWVCLVCRQLKNRWGYMRLLFNRFVGKGKPPARYVALEMRAGRQRLERP